MGLVPDLNSAVHFGTKVNCTVACAPTLVLMDYQERTAETLKVGPCWPADVKHQLPAGVP